MYTYKNVCVLVLLFYIVRDTPNSLHNDDPKQNNKSEILV